MDQKITKFYQKQIKKVTQQLIPKYKPEKIILYGSAARGDFTLESDLDFLLIKKTKKNFLERNFEASLALKTEIPVDVFVFTPKELEKGIKTLQPFIIEALKTGKLLYDAHQA